MKRVNVWYDLQQENWQLEMHRILNALDNYFEQNKVFAVTQNGNEYRMLFEGDADLPEDFSEEDFLTKISEITKLDRKRFVMDVSNG